MNCILSSFSCIKNCNVGIHDLVACINKKCHLFHFQMHHATPLHQKLSLICVKVTSVHQIHYLNIVLTLQLFWNLLSSFLHPFLKYDLEMERRVLGPNLGTDRTVDYVQLSSLSSLQIPEISSHDGDGM